MFGDKTQVIVVETDCASHSMLVRQLHHRNFPELRAEGKNCMEGGAYLVNLLMRARSSVSSGWRRNLLDRAIADVSEFVDDQERSNTTRNASYQGV